MTTLEDAISKRVKSFNPYSTVKLLDPDPKDVDKLIIEAAWNIQHPPRQKKVRA